MIYSSGGSLKVRCSDPYDSEQSDEFDQFGSLVATAATLLFAGCLAFFIFMRWHYVPARYTHESLQSIFEDAAESESAGRNRGLAATDAQQQQRQA